MTECVINLCGCFNPPTVAHISLLTLARNKLHDEGFTDCLGFLTPTHSTYSKPGLLDSPTRKALCELSVEDIDWISVNDFEITRGEWTKTIITLKHLQEVNPHRKVFMVCGADLVYHWNDPVWNPDDVREILDTFGVIIISREDISTENITKKIPVMEGHMKNVRIIHENPLESISSTYVRNLIHENKSVSGLVVPKVEKYIKEHNLYK